MRVKEGGGGGGVQWRRRGAEEVTYQQSPLCDVFHVVVRCLFACLFHCPCVSPSVVALAPPPATPLSLLFVSLSVCVSACQAAACLRLSSERNKLHFPQPPSPLLPPAYAPANHSIWTPFFLSLTDLHA